MGSGMIFIFMEFFMMKKTAIALGIAAMAFGAQAAEWMVTPDHKVEVNIDVGAYFQQIKSSTGQTTSTLLGAGVNQIQFKSTKTLAGGVKLIGQVELDYDPIVDNYYALTDDTKIGVDVPVWGRLTVGQWDSFMEDNVNEALGFWGIGDTAAFVDEPLAYVMGSSSRGSVDSKHIQYYNKYENLELAIDLNVGWADLTYATPMYGVATTIGYKLGDLQMYFGSATLPAYYSDYSGSSFANTVYRTNAYTNGTGFTANYTMGNTKVAGLIFTAQTLAGAFYNMGGFAVEQTIDAWKVGFTMQNVNYGGSNQYSQYAAGVNYTVAPKTFVFFEGKTLGVANGYNDAFEFGMRTTF
jgi:hypothetical protein